MEKEVNKSQKSNVPESLTVYIPRNLDIDKILLNNPPVFNYHRDKFLYIISLMYSIPEHLNDFDFERNKGFVPVYATILQGKIHDYKLYLNYLIENGILETDGKYSHDGGKSYWFRFTQEYSDSNTVPVVITRYTLIKSIVLRSHPKDKDSYLPEIPLDAVPYLTKWFNENLQIDKDRADAILLDIRDKELENPETKDYAKRKYNIRKISVDKISNREYTLSIDRTSGRFHSPLTRLKTEVRPCISYAGKKLVSLDLKNSQPFLSLTLLDIDLYEKNRMQDILSIYNGRYKNITDRNGNVIKSPSTIMLEDFIRQATNSPEALDYKNSVVKGTIYEDFALLTGKYGYIPEGAPQSYIDSYNPRKSGKMALFEILFSPNNSPFSERRDGLGYFFNYYGSVYNVFRLAKQGRRTHNALACSLQYLEAQLILHGVCRIIGEENPDIPLFTIHDSIITTEEHVDFILQIMRDVIRDAIGCEPMIKIESWE
ncbi:hypothetical protein FACS1894179_04310 [Bacteroidia bacterium]|nr:hypothetical protein FACS1894169_07660 [Bacteroidia bacterium]GHV39419.1 hypothetical protein FACS1894179_04310 [Bacteroidia bacterium]